MQHWSRSRRGLPSRGFPRLPSTVMLEFSIDPLCFGLDSHMHDETIASNLVWHQPSGELVTYGSKSCMEIIRTGVVSPRPNLILPEMLAMFQDTSSVRMYSFTAYVMHNSRLFCWTETNNIWSAGSSRESAVRVVSSFTWFWWSPPSRCKSECEPD